VDSGFYPFSGPAGKDDPSKPYPKWYYQNAGGEGVPAHSVEEFLYVVDAGYRVLFGGKFAADKPELWYLGVKDEKTPVLPRIAQEQTDEQEQIMRFIPDPTLAGEQSYPETLFQMYANGLPTRLTEWAQNAIVALKNAVQDTGKANLAVWCLGPANLNRMIGGYASGIPELLDEMAGCLFGSYGILGVDKPFAVRAGTSAFVVFPRHGACALEEQPGSAVYLTKIIIPRSACALIREQLRRYGL
jgi:hypothetical protein